jgi:hydroxymethylpyrimidine pyrophosphatase-like HAD family hydrolase
MYFLALAADYDGTLARNSIVDAPTLAALGRLKQSGRKIILLTGRELTDLKAIFPEIGICDRVVAENGALLFDPATEEQKPLAAAPPTVFVDALKRRGVPLSVGRSIVATWEPHEKTVLQTIRDFGLELQIIFNKGAVMVLPAGVTKATGLAVALEELGLSAHNVVGIGDAENDHAFMTACGSSAAVDNALPMLKRAANIRLAGDHGAGVAELVGLILGDETVLVSSERHSIPVGKDRAGREIAIDPQGSVLIAGTSGIGKSTLATALMERMVKRGFEFCIFDPEGDYSELANAVSIGDAATPPQIEQALELLERGTNVVVNTQNFKIDERPSFFEELLPRLTTQRARSGRPHWLFIDEAHHLIPAERSEFAALLPDDMPAVVFVTVHPESVAAEALQKVTTVIALGDAADGVLESFCAVLDVDPPDSGVELAADEVLFWDRRRNADPTPVKAYRPEQTRRRHTRKYAEGDLGPEGSFYFSGPLGRLNLRAQNLQLFVQIGEGVDDETWEHHRGRRDYSRWFRDVIHDEDLAAEAACIEGDSNLDARESRRRIAAAVSERYTAPATGARRD